MIYTKSLPLINEKRKTPLTVKQVLSRLQLVSMSGRKIDMEKGTKVKLFVDDYKSEWYIYTDHGWELDII